MYSQFTNYFFKFFNTILWLIYICLISIIVWGINKGFDLTDEGFFALLTIQNQEDFFKIIPIFKIIGKITTVFNPGIIFWRISRITLLTLSSFIFCFCLINWIKSTIKVPTSIQLSVFYPICGIASLMNYSSGFQGLSYNSLSLIIVQIIVGLYLYYISHDPNIENNYAKRSLLFLTIGFFIGWLTTIKFTTAILLISAIIFITFCILVLIQKKSFNDFTNQILLLISGFLLSMIIVSILYQSPLTIIMDTLNKQKLIVGHDPSDLLKMYVKDFKNDFLFQFIFNKPIVIISPFVMLIFFRNKINILFIITTICVCLLITQYTINHEHFYKVTAEYHNNTNDLYRILVSIFIIFFVIVFIDRHSRKIILPFIENVFFLIVIMTLFLFLPFACSFGTNVSLSIHITQFIFFGIVMICISILLISITNQYSLFIFPIGVTLLMINAASQIISGFIISPFRLNRPLTEQQYNIPTLTNNNQVLFDVETKKFITGVMHTFEKNHIKVNEQPVLIFDYPGLVYLLGALSPGKAGYSGGGYENVCSANCLVFNSSRMRNINKTVFLFGNWCPPPEEFVNCVKQKGINFKENYMIIDSIDIPEKLRTDDKKGIGKMFFYLPKNKNN
jgi:hypothetical protein